MLEILNDYSEKPFSRDKIKEIRKGEEEIDIDEAGPEETKEKEHKPGSGFKFNFTTDDKAVKIKFDIKSADTDKNKIIEILEKLIDDIREDRIKEFNL